MNASKPAIPGHRVRLLISSLVGMLSLASTSACTDSLVCADVNNGCAEGGSETGSDTGFSTPSSRDVDILFVIDNSGSMGEEQALLAANVASLIEALEAPDVESNYRIGITTTDNGNFWCSPGTTTPEAGRLVMSSCKTRLEDFAWDGGAAEFDVQDLACNDVCALDEAALEILPTTTFNDPEPKPRPWLERINGQKNIPEGTDSAAAFACFVPQGIKGCGFESTLESMYLALERTGDISEDSYDFMRPDALLAVVFVTDEADCSANNSYSTIFEPDGNRVFWSDPDSSFPSSAVCWNAGVACSGDPSNYDDCNAVNKDVDGNIGVSDADAVLHPMSRYLDLLSAIEDEKNSWGSGEDKVIVTLIGGVTDTGELVYADASISDPQFHSTFGIGPGCEAPNPLDPNEPVKAVPPVRLRELSEAFTPDNMFSICAPDYTPAFEALVDRLRIQVQPACFLLCVADTDPATAIVEPECILEQHPPNAETVVISECARDGSGYVIDPESNDYVMPSDAINVCHALLVDANGLTPDPSDDMSQQCVDEHYNLEFEIVRRPGFPALGGTTITAACSLAEFPDIECPGIGG